MDLEECLNTSVELYFVETSRFRSPKLASTVLMICLSKTNVCSSIAAADTGVPERVKNTALL
jgi:hypothetical protein